MKRPAALLLIVVTALAAFAETSNSPSDAKPSPAERSIAQAKQLMQKNPKDFEAYNALALALSRRVYVMNQGRVQFQGTPDELRRDPTIQQRFLEV